MGIIIIIWGKAKREMENKGNRRLTHTKNICLLYRLNGCECVDGLGGRLLILGGCNGVKLSSAGGGGG